RHIHIRRTLRLTPLATETEIHHFIDLFVVIPVHLITPRKELPQDIGPRPRRILLIARGHKGRAHRSARQMRLAAVPAAIALLRMLQDILVLEPEQGGEGGRLLPRLIPQLLVHRRRLHDLAGIEDILRVPAALYLPEQLVILRPYHPGNELPPQPAIPVL